MKNSGLVSVIVPMYNVEKYLSVCVNSILNQTYINLEIILVDDGSPDSSGQIADTIKDTDNRIKVIHKKNAGLNMARKTGFENSTGEWILFVDSDDALHSRAVEILLSAKNQTKTDVVIGGYQRFSEDFEIETDEALDAPRVIHQKDTEEATRWLIRDSPYPNVFMQTAWMKLYARSVINAIDWKASNYRANEDEFMALQYYPLMKNGVTIVPEGLYYYRINNASITRRIYNNKFDGKQLNKFETIENLYQTSLKILGKRYEKDLLIRFVVQFLGFTEQYLSEGNLSDEILEDYTKYFKPKLEKINTIDNELNDWNKSRLIAVKEKGVFGLVGASVKQLQKQVDHAHEVLAQKDAEIKRLHDRLIYLESPVGMIRAPLGKIKRIASKGFKRFNQ